MFLTALIYTLFELSSLPIGSDGKGRNEATFLCTKKYLTLYFTVSETTAKEWPSLFFHFICKMYFSILFVKCT